MLEPKYSSRGGKQEPTGGWAAGVGYCVACLVLTML